MGYLDNIGACFMADAVSPQALHSLKPLGSRASRMQQLVRARPMYASVGFPLLIEPARPDVDLADWVSANLPEIENLLRCHGAILFRGFQTETREMFDQLLAAARQSLIDYEDQHTPRTALGNKVFTSTEYPADQQIPFHSENSKNRSWPRKIWFCALQPASSGGETPIADNRKVISLISQELLSPFVEKGILYTRNYGVGLGLSWQQAFQVRHREEVEGYCKRNSMTCQWVSETHLRVQHRGQAVIDHPETGERLWFNQANLFHWGSLDENVRQPLIETVGIANLPSNAFYGDGTEIPIHTIEEINRAYHASAVSVPWLKGDVLLLDNMLMAHGRAPYKGSRKVLVAMAERYSPVDVTQVHGNV